jgi:aromatic-L-amino-acid decarboxylase
MAYFGITGSAPGILGELVSSAINSNGMLWKTCPALTELERVVLRWYATALGLPHSWFGMIADTASTSTLVALAAAREAAGLNVREEGLSGKPPLVLYCSEEAHSSVDKAGLVLGLGMRGIRRISSDGDFRMRVDALESAILRDYAEGRRPFAVVATVGTTSATAVDPVPEILPVCRRHNLWLHVDAAYAGSAAVAPEFRWALAGCDQADSLVVNPHKWLFTPIDCSVLYTSKREAFRAAFALVPEYLKTDVHGAVDLMDYSFQLGRRFRALKLWFVFRYFGTEGLAARIREHVRLGQAFTSWIDANPAMERLAPVPFSTVCFRVHPAGIRDEEELQRLNTGVLEQVNATGEVFLSHTKLKGIYCLRVAIGNLQTDRKRVRRAYDLICEKAGLDAAGLQ